MLLRGAVSLSRQVRGDDVEVSRTDQRGVYGGATQAYLGDQVEQTYRNSLRAVVDAEFFVLPAEDFAHALRSWFPMPMHLLEGLFFGMRDSQTIVGELTDWLEEHGVGGAWDLAPILVGGGLDAAWLGQVKAAVGPADLEAARCAGCRTRSTPNC
ncbi:hypothetical protein ACLQ24_23365 [Micromonospora sp. DT4]|uniref:hypothetical protein n=1 Tax=Micromonospora sp. DT4 TaxID=3393438 RepID=UPI003CF25FF0